MRLSSVIAETFARFSAARGSEAARAPTRGPERNPFLEARNEFANAFGDLARGKRNWQVMAFGLCGLLALLAIAEMRLAGSARVVPYVVQVDRLGHVVAIGPAEELKEPETRLVASELAQFVRAIRTVLPVSAGAAQAELLRRGYAFAGPGAAAFLNDYFSSPDHDPRVLGLRLARQVDVASVLRVPGSEVWRLQWTETERSIEPGPTRTVSWESYVTVKIVPPRTAEAVQENPLGLLITSVSWTQVAESGAPAQGEAVGTSGPSVAAPDSGALP